MTRRARGAAVAAPAGSRLADVAKAAALKAERAIIEDTLQQVHWNRRRAAEQLGVSYKTLLNKIKETRHRATVEVGQPVASRVPDASALRHAD